MFPLVPAEISARGSLAVKAYNKAIQEGETPVMRVPIMLIGQAQSGKTSLKKSLKREKFNDKEAVTDGIERDPSYFSVTNETISSEETKGEEDGESAVSYHNRTAKCMVDQIEKISKKKPSLKTNDRNIVSQNSPKLEDTLAQSEENIAEPTGQRSETLSG